MSKKKEVSKCCDTALELLIEIREKITQIIEYKKSHPASGSDDLFRRQVGAFMAALNTLHAINENIEDAIAGVKKLCQQAQQLLNIDEPKDSVSLSPTEVKQFSDADENEN